MANLTSVLKYLEQERNRLGAQLERLNHALSVLIGTSNHRTRRRLSAAGRARIAAAQRARWARSKGQKVVSILARKGRTISPAARKNWRSPESALGKVAEGTKEGLDSSRPRAMACKENDPWKRPISLGVSARPYNTLGKTSDKVNSMRCTASAIWRLIPSDSCWRRPSWVKISTCKALQMWW